MTLDDIAPYPKTDAEVTADALARNLAVCMQLNWPKVADPDVNDQEQRAAIATVVNLYGIVRLLRTLRLVTPGGADEVARELWADWEDGGVIGENLWEWLVEYGIDPDQVNRIAEDEAREATR